MNALNDFTHDAVREWLFRALHGEEPLPRLTPDESHYVAILRLEKTLNPPIRASLRDGSLQLLRQFCAKGDGDAGYVEEMISLAAAFDDPEAVQALAQLARRFPQLPGIPADIRLAVLAALVDMRPPQNTSFWSAIIVQDPEQYSGLALSGVLSTSPFEATELLPKMPENESAGRGAALNLDLAWDDLLPKDRSRFVDQIEKTLALCGWSFAKPVREWIAAKNPHPVIYVRKGLLAALSSSLRGDANAKYTTSKLIAA